MTYRIPSITIEYCVVSPTKRTQYFLFPTRGELFKGELEITWVKVTSAKSHKCIIANDDDDDDDNDDDDDDDNVEDWYL